MSEASNALLGARRDWRFVVVHVPWLGKKQSAVRAKAGCQSQMKADVCIALPVSGSRIGEETASEVPTPTHAPLLL